METTPRSYHATSGPENGPIRQFDTPRMLDVVADDPVNLLGSAQLVGWVFNDDKPIATYRLMIGGIEAPGLFICVDRRFELVVA